MGEERTEIGLVYRYTSKWIAGGYYIQNIIFALNTLDDKDKPFLNIYTTDEKTFEDLYKLTGYPYMTYHHYDIESRPFLIKVINKILKKINYYNYKSIDCINLEKTKNVLCYPIDNIPDFKCDEKKLAWIPDFQEKYLKEMFSSKGLDSRSRVQNRLVLKNIPIVFSSHDSENDFHKFFPKAKNKTFVLQFAVTHPDFSNEDINKLKNKFGVKGDYFFCANQFWKHKNHLFLFKSYKKYLDKGGQCQLVCSGELRDYRDKKYADSIRTFIQENKLEEKIKILGFIERTEQLCLMKNSYALIQPSLFEGWSTTVEDAKKLNKFIFLSNLRVHIEQNPKNVCYFDPHNEDELCDMFLNTVPTAFDSDYDANVREFGKKFLEIIENFKNIKS